MANKELGEKIKKYRTDIGYTQEELARTLGLKNKTTLSSWEVGKSEPDYAMIAKLLDVFKITADTFFDWRNKNNTEQNILTYFRKLSPIGQEKAIEQVKNMTYVPEYQINNDAIPGVSKMNEKE